MRAIRTLGIWAFAFIAIGSPSSAVFTQQTCEIPSLGTLARQLKARRSQKKRKPAHVFTNDTLHAQSAPLAESDKKAELTKAKERSKTESPLSPPPSPLENNGEKYFRSKADAIRSRLELHERQLAALKQQLGLMSTEYYPNPQKTLEEESTPTFHADVNKLRSKIEETKRRIADDRKAMADLWEELRRKGGDPGWIR